MWTLSVIPVESLSSEIKATEENQALYINIALWTENKDIPKDMERAQ